MRHLLNNSQKQVNYYGNFDSSEVVVFVSSGKDTAPLLAVVVVFTF